MALSLMTTSTMKLGIECCRRGDWNEGLRYLRRIAEGSEPASGLPGIFYSYLGYGIALCQQRVPEGLKLCQHSIKVEFYQAENYLNLARTCLLAKDRRGAVRAVRGGLKIDPQNPELLGLYQDLGIRSLPVLPFLDRKNPLNQILGRIRHAFRKPA
jgi:tetratricopeptide (TPR) repeat protein